MAPTIIGILGPGPEADDAGQETVPKFYDALDQFRGESSVRTYLTRIATNTVPHGLMKRKRQVNHPRSRDDPDFPLAEEAERDTHRAVELSERELLVHRAVQQLDGKHRCVEIGWEEITICTEGQNYTRQEHLLSEHPWGIP